MLYVIYANWGEPFIPREVHAEVGGKCLVMADNPVRRDSRFISWVLMNQDRTDFAVVDIPEEATDWMVIEQDGYERVIVVINGKLVQLTPIQEEP